MSILHYSIIVILVIMMIIYTASTVEAQNSTNVTIPHNAIKTPNGGWITPLETTDENGRNLTMHYETGMPVSGKLNPGPPPDPLFLTDSRGNIDNFFTAHQILIRADVYPQSSARTATVEINMSSDTGFAFDDKKHLVFTPNATHVQQAIWQFLPTKAGNYTIEKISNGVHVSSVSFSVFDSKTGLKYPVVVSPLKQFRWGILPENIQCKDNFQLIFKTDDDSPACVKPDTAKKLIERGWARIIVTKASFDVIQSNTTRTDSMEDLGTGTGIVNWKNQTYYFETPNYTKTTNATPMKILFHGVLFTLFPSTFGGMSFGECKGTYYLTDAKFSDGTSEVLDVFAGSSCGYDYTPIKLSTHTNPQAGLIFYDGKMKLLVSTNPIDSDEHNIMIQPLGQTPDVSNKTDITKLRVHLSGGSGSINRGSDKFN
ncbi:MAG: hypothetical protein KGH95_07010, partial [Thaumarchaeota archaeon]|nr:hypothetical protein [Nitrososphaerota archaeon]